MCGIYGIQYQKQYYSKDNIIKRADRMQEAAKYRGPDASGHTFKDTTVMGMTRLSIFDKLNYDIPVSSTRSILSYNGEIYDFNTNIDLPFDRSDTGALLNFLDLGKSIEDLNGMFAFAWYEKSSRKLVLARDRAGEKPLYYYKNKGLFIFASDIKIILAGLNDLEYPKLINTDDMEFFELNCNEQTPFDGIKLLKPGHKITISDTEIIEKRTYLSARTTEYNITKDILDEGMFILKDAVRIRCKNRAGTLASFLSGGLDSSLITALSNPDFAVLGQYDIDGYNEGDEVEVFAKDIQIPLHIVKPTKEDFERIFPKLPFLLDTPATWTAFNQFMVFDEVNKQNCRVCMSGEGADELFGGYARYRIIYHLNNMYIDTVLNDAYHPMISSTFGNLDGLYLKLTNRSKKNESLFPEIKNFYTSIFSSHKNYINAMGEIDFETSMQVLLQMPDRIGLYHNVESRAPFLDPRLIAFSKALPEHLKINKKQSKVLMRKIAKKIIPQYKAESLKKGFGVPYNYWYGDGGYSRTAFYNEYMKKWISSFENSTQFNKSMRKFQNELGYY